MRKILALTLILSLACTATAQQAPAPPNKSDWSSVQSLKLGTVIHISSDHGKVVCGVVSVTADSITCGAYAPFPRAQVRSIRKTRRTASTFAGLGIGFAVGIGIGAAAARCNTVGCDAAVGFVIFLGLVAGPIVGYLTDFVAPTVYRRP